jgi:predicted AAA+ superfamily ATPase
MTDPIVQLVSSFAIFLARAEKLLERLEPLLPPASPAPDWEAATAFRWRKSGGSGYLQAIAKLPAIRLHDLHDIDPQKARIDANTRQFEEIVGIEREALNWAVMRGSRSGRVAWQFAKDWAGTHGTAHGTTQITAKHSG